MIQYDTPPIDCLQRTRRSWGLQDKDMTRFSWATSKSHQHCKHSKCEPTHQFFKILKFYFKSITACVWGCFRSRAFTTISMFIFYVLIMIQVAGGMCLVLQVHPLHWRPSTAACPLCLLSGLRVPSSDVVRCIVSCDYHVIMWSCDISWISHFHAPFFTVEELSTPTLSNHGLLLLSRACCIFHDFILFLLLKSSQMVMKGVPFAYALHSLHPGHKYASFRWVPSDLVKCHFSLEHFDSLFYGGQNFTDYVEGNRSEPSEVVQTGMFDDVCHCVC